MTSIHFSARSDTFWSCTSFDVLTNKNIPFFRIALYPLPSTHFIPIHSTNATLKIRRRSKSSRCSSRYSHLKDRTRDHLKCIYFDLHLMKQISTALDSPSIHLNIHRLNKLTKGSKTRAFTTMASKACQNTPHYCRLKISSTESPIMCNYD